MTVQASPSFFPMHAWTASGEPLPSHWTPDWESHREAMVAARMRRGFVESRWLSGRRPTPAPAHPESANVMRSADSATRVDVTHAERSFLRPRSFMIPSCLAGLVIHLYAWILQFSTWCREPACLLPVTDL